MKKRIIVSVAAVLVIVLILSVLTSLVMPKYTDNKDYQGSKIDLDSNVALES